MYVYICVNRCVCIYIFVCILILKAVHVQGPKRIVEMIEHVRISLILEYLRACVCRSENAVRVRVCVRLKYLRLHGYTFESVMHVQGPKTMLKKSVNVRICF